MAFHDLSKLVIAVLIALFLGAGKSTFAQSARVTTPQSTGNPEFTSGILLYTQDIESLPWPRMAAEAGLTTIGIHPGGGQHEPRMLENTIAWIQSDIGQTFLRECEQNNIQVEYEIHALRELLPRNLFTDHPEYFRVDRQGRRNPDINFCFHSQAALDIISRNAVSFSRVCRPTTGRYFFWLDDRKDGFCNCEDCRKYLPSEQSLIYENFLQRRLQETDDRATVAHLAYHATLAAPRVTMIRPDDGIFLEYAPIKRSYEKPYAEQTESINGNRHLIDNLRVFPRETAQVLEYWMDVSKFSRWKRPFQKLPWRQNVFDQDVRYYRELGLQHVTSFGNGTDADYVRRFGNPPLAQFGAGLRRRFAPDPVLHIPRITTEILVDGSLTEECYTEHQPLADFRVPGHAAAAASTRCWSFWLKDRLIVSFECVDETPANARPSSTERDVDGQDRVEFFIWNGDPNSPYYCLEIASGGAVHDYRAHFYRRFDDSWSPIDELDVKVVSTANGYVVESALSAEAIEEMGLALTAGQEFRIGLFRADFERLNGDPVWITWIDHGGDPDFHVARSFGKAVLKVDVR